MVEAGQVSWDVADLSVADSTLLGKAGIARQIDYGIVPKDSVIPGFAYEFAVASYLFSSIISYDRKALGGNAPAGWADFWNVEKFPGKRAMYKHIEGTLEAGRDLVEAGTAAERRLERRQRRERIDGGGKHRA